MYKCGNKIITLKKKAVDKFKEWNMFPFNQNVRLDYRVIRVLVFSCLKKMKYENSADEEAFIMFVERLFLFIIVYFSTLFPLYNSIFDFILDFIRVRAGNDEGRIASIHKSIEDIINKNK